jgi:hypothetical protein
MRFPSRVNSTIGPVKSIAGAMFASNIASNAKSDVQIGRMARVKKSIIMGRSEKITELQKLDYKSLYKYTTVCRLRRNVSKGNNCQRLAMTDECPKERHCDSVDRCFQAILIISVGSLSWLLMMVLHECGHVVHGWFTGATLQRIDLPLVGFSQTDFAANPHPLIVAWGGGIGGCLFPLVILGMVRIFASRYVYLAAWFAGFCLIANGAYLGCGAFTTNSYAGDDASVIIANGGSTWHLLVFGFLTIAAGLYLWSGLGPKFGLGPNAEKIDRKSTIGAAIALSIIVCLDLFFGSK